MPRKMELQVEIISSEMIMPSTPTPQHLNRYKFSLLDQYFQYTYVPYILFYKSPPFDDYNHGCTNQMTTVARLKKLLSLSRSLFYPFACRITSDKPPPPDYNHGPVARLKKLLSLSLSSLLYPFAGRITSDKPPPSDCNRGCTNQMTIVARLKKLFDRSLSVFYPFVGRITSYKSPPSDYDHGCKNQMTTIARLKESLSESLSLFYPFAGRITSDESAIECNNKGVSFVVARAIDCSLMSFLEATNRVDFVGRFLSKNTYYHDITGDSSAIYNNNDNTDIIVTKLVPVMIQVTIFECGGIVISSQYLHKVCDAATWGNFLKTWASFAAKRNEDVLVPDCETAASLFPPRNRTVKPVGRKVKTVLPLTDNEAAEEVDNGLCIVKAFVFSSQAISALKAKGTSDDVPNPTRIEVVSGFIWKHAMSAACATSSISALSGLWALKHAVNMRPRFHPPLASSTFGNLAIETIAPYEGDKNPDLPDLVCCIRKSLSMAKDAGFLTKFQGEEGSEVLWNYKQKSTDVLTNKNIRTFSFTSWGRLDMNPDFGWGLPVWAGVAGGILSSSFKNHIILTENCNGGIEAWLMLDEQEMLTLQADEDFLEFASPSAGKLLKN